jgi:hypothetical protein
MPRSIRFRFKECCGLVAGTPVSYSRIPGSNSGPEDCRVQCHEFPVGVGLEISFAASMQY